MNNKMMWALVVVALLVGAYGGYAYEKAKFVKLMEGQRMDMQRQIDEAKMSQQSAAVPTDLVMIASDDKLGTYAVDPAGMTLYTYDKDTEGKSNCVDTCATNWPPYLVAGSVPAQLPEHLGTTTRADGSIQYTWDGMPLYYYVKDKAQGDVTGDGVGGVWHLVK